MPARFRSALPFALAMGVASITASPRLAHAQAASFAPAAASAPATAPAATPAPAGPTFEAAQVGVRHMATAPAPARRAGFGQGQALMIVGGAAVLVGLLIGGGAGSAIAVGGAIIGLVGLYEYLQ
jgi:hypothetical protein